MVLQTKKSLLQQKNFDYDIWTRGLSDAISLRIQIICEPRVNRVSCIRVYQSV